jgi:hypothetical protein
VLGSGCGGVGHGGLVLRCVGQRQGGRGLNAPGRQRRLRCIECALGLGQAGFGLGHGAVGLCLVGARQVARPHAACHIGGQALGIQQPILCQGPIGLRVPLGGGDRAQAKQAAARAEALAAEARATAERDRLAADIAAAVARVKATQTQRDALARHAALAQGTRGFIDKAFRLGEADGPTRLRVELEAAQAERQLARARIDAAAAISHLRQALGLLPQ